MRLQFCLSLAAFVIFINTLLYPLSTQAQAACTMRVIGLDGQSAVVQLSGLSYVEGGDNAYTVELGSATQASNTLQLNPGQTTLEFNFSSVSDPDNTSVTAYAGSPRNDISGSHCSGSSQVTQPVTLSQAYSQSGDGEGTGSTAEPCSEYAADSNDYERCMAERECENRVNAEGESGRSAGYVFIPAFNNACTDLVEFSQTTLNYIMMFASIIAGFMFARGAYGVLVSRGNPAAVAEARDMLMHAAIGLVLIGTAYAIVVFLNEAFQFVDPGINLLGPLFR